MKQLFSIPMILQFLCFLFETHYASGTKDEVILLTAKQYSLIFKERRLEQQLLIKKILKFSYEKQYKILTLGYNKELELINTYNATLLAANYKPSTDGFPLQQTQLQEAVIAIMENCCLLAESLLHFPEISYRILKKSAQDWRAMLNGCVALLEALPHITEESTVRLMQLLVQEINPEQRTADYKNPYYAKASTPTAATEKQSNSSSSKQRRKLKRGPQLSGGAAHIEL